MNSLVEPHLGREEQSFSAPRVVDALLGVLPAHCVLHREEDTRPYECDGLSLYRALPPVVVLPETEEQVVAVMRLCKRLNVPLVARGAGTGLSGGAMPHSQGVLMGLAKFNRIKRIDPAAGVAVVGPGVRNLAISEAAAAHGLYYAPDPSSQIACSIGGNVAENSGGVHCLKYGLTVHNVLAVRVVTIDGDVVELGSEAPDAPGLDLLALFIGSEGMLGIVTEVTVKLIPKPACARVVMASFSSVEAAGQAVTDIIAAGIIPAGLEMMDRQAVQMVEPFVNAGYDVAAQAILLCESDGTAEEVAHEIEHMEAVFRKAGATRLQVSRDEAERLTFWAGRKNAFPAAGRVSPDYYCMDGTIPRRHLARVLGAIEQMEDEYGLRCANVFHAGDGNLHPLILFDSNKPDEVERAEKFGAAILELCVKVGGTLTGEHGVGMEKINQMCVQFSRDELDAFVAVKRAFDPPGLLNPEKVIPTLARCAEYGKMHVHAGELSFPELARF
ncbi:FAD-linked oxidase C-terminal domain-containing protein [Bordetella petrii]|uniref:FAD-linked oxidase C-terminal domain-containing protein n=1 Tax=Bordetella petrii TaxID=94624 RepID=A0ABT7W1V1_9BORD|nr:FAD-linked oxidase C-terminal domain-containing protein [Bordetella petrii]MDM9559175.1 FAD-linked oxidase C-terminal domain-containing protein [Bordetella petrii]